jgi:hypothetical protein
MKNHSLAVIFTAQLLLLLTGCPSSSPVPPSPNNTEQVSTAGPTLVQLCEVNCQKQPNLEYIKLPLKTSESNSLLNAVPIGQKVTAATHLDASVVNGGLVFKSDSEPTHITDATTTTISVAAHGTVPATNLKVFATPEAAALMHKRIGK